MDYYFLLDEKNFDLFNIIQDCRARHQIAVPDATLSVRNSHSGDEKLIKVAGVDQAWLDAREWPVGAVIWEFQKGDEIGDIVRQRWNDCQCDTFKGIPPGDEIFDYEQRHAYWYDAWQDMISE